ncbi:MAG: NADH-quinone oxidoreductase subunit C [Mariprofundales bacterium]
MSTYTSTDTPALNAICKQFSDDIYEHSQALDCPQLIVSISAIVDFCHAIKAAGYAQLIDLCAVDMSEFPNHDVNSPRFFVVYHLLSVEYNSRLRLKVAIKERQMIDSVTEVWPGANWFEREAFDLFGIIFNHHPDLRRLLTDYGFEGHPLRKDFPLTGRVELSFDKSQWRCVYKPNELENRVLIPKTWPGVDRG